MVRFTMLNAMASTDFVQSLDIQKSLGIEVLDLKDQIFGKTVAELTVSEAREAAALIASRGLSVYCLSTQLFHVDIRKGEREFERSELAGVDRVIEIANILQPAYVRILPAMLRQDRSQPGSCMAAVRRDYPWLLQLYRAAVDRLSECGHRTVIENELGSILGSPEDILTFFELVDRPGRLHFTYDVQNLWQMGTYPSVEVYRMLKPVIAYFHVKGGQEHPVTKRLQWKSSLADATWPIAEITREVVKDGVSPVICLNPSHGELREGCDYRNLEIRDLAYMKGITTPA